MSHIISCFLKLNNYHFSDLMFQISVLFSLTFKMVCIYVLCRSFEVCAHCGMNKCITAVTFTVRAFNIYSPDPPGSQSTLLPVMVEIRRHLIVSCLIILRTSVTEALTRKKSV